MQKQIPLSVFVFIDSSVVSALQDAGGYAISRQNNLLIELFYIGMPLVRTDGLSRARANKYRNSFFSLIHWQSQNYLSFLSSRPLPAPFDSPHFLLSSGSFNMALSRANCELKENACTAG